MKLSGSIMKLGNTLARKGQRYSPEILIGVGVVGMVTTVVMACRATASEKYANVVADHKEALENIKEARKISELDFEALPEEEKPTAVEKYSKYDMKMDTIGQYRKTIFGMTKVYWPTATVMSVSIACILGGFNIMKRRHVALMAAYNVLDAAFKQYRDRVKTELGDIKDQQFMYGGVIEDKTETKVDVLEDGTHKKTKITRQVLKGQNVSGYALLFDRENHQWAKDPNFNWLYLKKKRDLLNDRLHARGYVFLSEVYDVLDFQFPKGSELNKAAHSVGWIDNTYGQSGDSYISFGPWCEDLDAVVEAAITARQLGVEDSILLDFNVDGPITAQL